jgi:hypothetical protein
MYSVVGSLSIFFIAANYYYRPNIELLRENWENMWRGIGAFFVDGSYCPAAKFEGLQANMKKYKISAF